jgi:UDP-glucose 4-epimerase
MAKRNRGWLNIAPLVSHPRFRFAIDTITNEIVMDRLVSECDIVVHMAAVVGVELILKDPVNVIETNILGTHSVLKVANRYRKQVLFASTSEIYGKNENVPFSEEDDRVLGPATIARWSYSSSKAVDEFLSLAYHQKNDLPVVIFRLFNTVGPRQTGRYGMVIPRFVRQALSGDPITVYGDGNQARCFVHVKDAVEAIIALSTCPQAIGQVFNIGSTDEVSILELAHRVLKLADAALGRAPTGIDERVRLVPYEQAYPAGFEDMKRRMPDIGKIGRYVGWQPRSSLDEILQDVIQFSMQRSQ